MLLADTTLITMLQRPYVPHNKNNNNNNNNDDDVSSVQNFSELPQTPVSEIKYLGKSNLTVVTKGSICSNGSVYLLELKKTCLN